MGIISPQIPAELLQVEDFHSYVQDFLQEEKPVASVACKDETIVGADFHGIDVRGGRFRNGAFRDCTFTNASFIDVDFQSCDLSNSRFAGAYFERCRFADCKCVGVDMSDTVHKQVLISHSILQYAVFDETRMTDVLFGHTDFTGSSMSAARLKRFQATGSIFIRNNFFKTMLASVDFTDCEFAAPTVSAPPVELKGVVVSESQAVGLIGLWGIRVKR